MRRRKGLGKVLEAIVKIVSGYNTVNTKSEYLGNLSSSDKKYICRKKSHSPCLQEVHSLVGEIGK